jgi:hypothetical protein
MNRYKCPLYDIIIVLSYTGKGYRVAEQHCNCLLDEDQILIASFLSELIAILDR